MKIQIPQDTPKHLLERLDQDKPSAEASYWAKPSCKHCHGRGEIGKVRAVIEGNNTIEKDQLCACAKKNFKMWRENKLEEYKAEAKAKEGNGKSKKEEKKPVSGEFIMRVRRRLSNIEDEINEMNSSIASKQVEIAEAPFSDWMVRIENRDREALSRLEEMQDRIETMNFDATKAEAAAEKMRQRAKEMTRGAGKLREKVKELEKVDLRDLKDRLEAVRAEGRSASKRLDQVTHRLNHRIGVDQKRLEKLEARREKVIAESGLEDTLLEGIPPQEVLEHR